MEGLLKNIPLREVSKLDHINYGYFVGKNRKSVYDLRSVLYDSQLNPVIIRDADHQNALFVKILDSEAARFLEVMDEFNFKRIKLSGNSIAEVKWMFGDGYPSIKD